MDLNPARAAIEPYLFWIKLAVVVIFVGSIFWAGWSVCDWRWESKENRERKDLIDKMDKERAAWEVERLKWETKSEITAGQISALETTKDSLLATLNGLKLTRTITVKPNAQGECESAVLDDTFRMRWNAVVENSASGVTPDSGE